MSKGFPTCWLIPFTSCSSAGSGPLVVRTVDAPLKTGDYSIQGHEDLVTVARKSHQDLVARGTHGRRRFEAEFERMSRMEYAAVVVEASVGEVLHKPTAGLSRPRLDAVHCQ